MKDGVRRFRLGRLTKPERHLQLSSRLPENRRIWCLTECDQPAGRGTVYRDFPARIVRQKCESLLLTLPITPIDKRCGPYRCRTGHLHPYTISSGQTDKPFPHFSREVRQYDLLIGNLNPKHCPGEHSDNLSFYCDRILRRHDDRFISLKTKDGKVAEQIAEQVVPHELARTREPIHKEVVRYLEEKAELRSPNWTRDGGHVLRAWAAEMMVEYTAHACRRSTRPSCKNGSSLRLEP